LGHPVGIGGGTFEGAADAASRLLDGGADGLISFGLAGGLDPAVRPGMVVVPVSVLTEQGTFAADAGLAAWFGGLTGHHLWGGQQVVVSTAEKAALFERTGAAAIDLESGAVAQAASVRGVPFIAVRAVCDPAERGLPPAALVALGSSGGIGIWRVLGSVLRQPGQVPELLALARDAAAARRGLVAACLHTGAGTLPRI
jgi:adenosylhomocysteine nucleosidase